MKPKTVNKIVEEVTIDIIKRSKSNRLKYLKKLNAAKNSNIVGADINELAPIKGFNSYNFLVAKLAYKILSYKFLI